MQQALEVVKSFISNLNLDLRIVCTGSCIKDNRGFIVWDTAGVYSAPADLPNMKAVIAMSSSAVVAAAGIRGPADHGRGPMTHGLPGRTRVDITLADLTLHGFSPNRA